ncbi:MAG: 4Fe-4S ferredoxin [Chlorobium limicola]|uniref:4Fe-4S dicluster domain-containing protein n=1 Tax=Chlorobium limicola TaxID=1092 RepID=UPI0023F23788|nr:4Fe-4S dicluster domain-containing protein [Chlorobium limicola]NTV20866.1 4Fe-4S ferredoxin [Chlorobium limicola]
MSGSASPAKKKKRLLAPREEIAWFPVIDAEQCNGCEACADLCRPGVFAPGPSDPSGVCRPKMTVANPFNCIVLCTRCEPVCPSGAITLPRPEDFERFVEYVD